MRDKDITRRAFLLIGLLVVMLVVIFVVSVYGDGYPAIGPTDILAIAPDSNPGKSPAATYTDKKAEELKQHFRKIMDEGKRRWEALGIKNYQIITSYKNGYFDETKIITVTVKNNEVVANTAVAIPALIYRGPPAEPGPYKSTDFTVPGLFDTLKERIYKFFPDKNVFNVSFDQTYGFPSAIIYDLKHITDSREETKVISFLVLQ